MARVLLSRKGRIAESFVITSKPAFPVIVDRDDPAPELPTRCFPKVASVTQKLLGITQIVDSHLRSTIYKGLANSHERTRP